jgi:hypothetical protein
MPARKQKKLTKSDFKRLREQAAYRAAVRAARLKAARIERAKQKTREWRSTHMFLGNRKY